MSSLRQYARAAFVTLVGGLLTYLLFYLIGWEMTPWVVFGFAMFLLELHMIDPKAHIYTGGGGMRNGPMKLFKIRHVSTGLYSSGGDFPDWTPRGKTWRGVAALRGHLRRHSEEEMRNWIVEEYHATKRGEGSAMSYFMGVTEPDLGDDEEVL